MVLVLSRNHRRIPTARLQMCASPVNEQRLLLLHTECRWDLCMSIDNSTLSCRGVSLNDYILPPLIQIWPINRTARCEWIKPCIFIHAVVSFRFSCGNIHLKMHFYCTSVVVICRKHFQLLSRRSTLYVGRLPEHLLEPIKILSVESYTIDCTVDFHNSSLTMCTLCNL